MFFFIFFFSLCLCLKRYLHFFQVPAGAMEESSEEDENSNVQDEIKKNTCITNKIFMTFFVKFGVITPIRA